MDIQEAKLMGQELIIKHNLFAWEFKLDDAKTRFGLCNHTKKTISVSKYLAVLNDEREIRDTILHEIAHALVGVRNGHNMKWKLKCVEIGCKPNRTYSRTIINPPKKWTSYCDTCGKEVARYKRANVACGKCCDKHNRGKFDKKYKLKYKLNKNYDEEFNEITKKITG